MIPRRLRLPATLSVSLIGLAAAGCGPGAMPDAGDAMADESLTDATPPDATPTDGDGGNCTFACGGQGSVPWPACAPGVGSDGAMVCVPTSDAGGGGGPCEIAAVVMSGSSICCCEPLV